MLCVTALLDLASTTEVYNEVARIEKVKLNGFTHIEALMTELR